MTKAMEFWIVMGHGKIFSPQLIKKIKWELSPHGQLKVNIDGTTKGNPILTDCSTIARDSYGNQIISCNRRLGITTNFVNESCGSK